MDMTVLSLPKPRKKQKEKKKLRQKTPIKAHYEPISEIVRQKVFETKGNKCLMGLCEHCGGMAQATDLHHLPHRAQNGQDILAHLWPINRLCHTHYHDHPIEEKEMFKVIEANGWEVAWRVELKGVSKNG